MENQHRKISGYRELSQPEIDLMNDIKAIGPQVKSIIEKLDRHLSNQIQNAYGNEPAEANVDEVRRLQEADPIKWMQQGATDIQKGLMSLTRAVAQPTFF